MRSRLLALAALLLVCSSLALPPALATEEEPTEESTTTTTFAEGEGPAVIDLEAEVEEAEEPWTVRFLIPTLVITAILIIAVVALYYFTRVKNRYRVV